MQGKKMTKTHNSKLDHISKRQAFASFLLQKDTKHYISTLLLIAFSYTIKCHFYRFSSFIFGQLYCYPLIGSLFVVQDFIKYIRVLKWQRLYTQIIIILLLSIQTLSLFQFISLITFFPSLTIIFL